MERHRITEPENVNYFQAPSESSSVRHLGLCPNMAKGRNDQIAPA